MNDLEKLKPDDIATDLLSTLEMPKPVLVDPEAVTEKQDVVIGSLLFDRDRYVSAPRRRPRVRSSSIL